MILNVNNIRYITTNVCWYCLSYRLIVQKIRPRSLMKGDIFVWRTMNDVHDEFLGGHAVGATSFIPLGVDAIFIVVFI